MNLVNYFRDTGTHRKVIDLVPTRIQPRLEELTYEAATLLNYGRRDMFTSVAIETTSDCNRRCDYCPVGHDEIRRPSKHMGESLYQKIIEQLAAIGYKGKLALQFYGEPLRDIHLDERISFAKSRLPEAQIVIYSNGDYLTSERFRELVSAGLSKVFVTNHNSNGKLSGALQELEAYLEQHPEGREHVSIRNGLHTLYNRGGLVQVDESKRIRMTHCISESHTLTIDVDGNVVLCSNDYHGSVSFGNVRGKGLMEIWDTPEFKTLRERKKSGKFDLQICKDCTS